MQFLVNLLILCSGADRNVLAQCPTERTKFAGIGATVLLTAILATVSGGYALFFTFKNYFLSVLFGLFWGLVIFNLDRFIVSSMRKTGHPRQELKMALPRFAIAIVLALTISKPLEVQLFHGSIKKQLGSEQDAYNQKCLLDFNNTLTALSQKKDALQKELVAQKGKLYSNDPVYQGTQKQSETLDERNRAIQQSIKDNDDFIRNNTITIRTTNAAGEAVTRTQLNAAAQLRRQDNRNLREEISNNNNRKTELGTQQEDRNENLTKQLEQLEAQNTAQQKGVQQQIDDLNSRRDTILHKCREDAAADDDILAQLRALGMLKKFGNTVWCASLMITLLFVLLEVAPITVKLLTKRGPYDEILEQIEYDIAADQKKKRMEKDAEVNAHEEAAQQIARQRIDTHLKAEMAKIAADATLNDTLLRDVSEKVSLLAQRQINNWYNDQSSQS